MHRWRACLIFNLLLFVPSLVMAADVAVKNVDVMKETGRFGGWPANNGIWSWGDEILVGFMLGYFKPNLRTHAIDPEKPNVLRFARSVDGGETWKLETPSFLDADGKEKKPTECAGGIDFTHPDFAARFRMSEGKGNPSRIYYSHDRGKTWDGPYALPMFDQKHIMARTDYIVLGKHDMVALITAAKENGREGHVFSTRTTDGGKTWTFESWVGPEPKGFAIMPSTVRTGENTLLTTIRREEGPAHWVDTYESTDLGKNWTFLKRAAESTGGRVGNPASTILLKDGRIATTYGYRTAPFGMRARLSEDKGHTWGDEIILRKDAGCWDLGYPRTVQRKDGRIVTIYYYNDDENKERYIAATIWEAPPKK